MNIHVTIIEDEERYAQELTEKVRNKFQEGLQKHEIEEYNIGYFLNGDKERSLIEIEKESKCGNKKVGWADIVYTILKE